MDNNSKDKTKEINKRIIKNYVDDEKVMVLIFAQWCVNNDVDALQLYADTYPEQGNNKLLEEMLIETVQKEESDHISDETIINILQIFGNDDLAFSVQRIIDRRQYSK